MATTTVDLSPLAKGLPLNPLPPVAGPLDPSVPHAPACPQVLDAEEKRLAITNSLRYFPPEFHALLAPEFAEELATFGHIIMRRFRPTSYEMKAYPVELYPAKCKEAACIMMMIMNNLDARVAQFPHELVTYGGNGRVFQNWAQYHLVMHYLSQMDEQQTLVMYSGHPMGLYPSPKPSPRVVITNGMMIPNYSSKEMHEKLRAMGVTMYGQMTAGSYAYIGPQGIVHGTTLTVLNAGRKYLHTGDLAGKLFVTSGLGGMSGAQGKAGRICGCVTVVAEVNEAAIMKRLKQGWIDEVFSDVVQLIEKIKYACKEKLAIAYAYHGNVVTLWEKFVELGLTPELGSDQTSLHNPFGGGYYPVQLGFKEGNECISKDPAKFKQLVQESLRRHVAALNALAARGMRFWDYGNSFLLESSRAGADVFAPGGKKFRYPSYVEDIMGDIFSLGFGPFRWVCCSCDPHDLHVTDELAASEIRRLMAAGDSPIVMQQYEDNLKWINKAEENKLVVGSQARILYSNAAGRVGIALEMNKAVADGRLKGPVVISRDHHDVSGTDSPFRETSNITDGSKFCADMAVQNFVGDSFRGASWISLHNGGGVGWGEVMNGGFGMVLDGSKEAADRARCMLDWDVMNGVSRRSWAGNKNAEMTVVKAMQENPRLKITMPIHADQDLVDKAVTAAFSK